MQRRWFPGDDLDHCKKSIEAWVQRSKRKFNIWNCSISIFDSLLLLRPPNAWSMTFPNHLANSEASQASLPRDPALLASGPEGKAWLHAQVDLWYCCIPMERVKDERHVNKSAHCPRQRNTATPESIYIYISIRANLKKNKNTCMLTYIHKDTQLLYIIIYIYVDTRCTLWWNPDQTEDLSIHFLGSTLWNQGLQLQLPHLRGDRCCLRAVAKVWL